ncbi:MAG: hypothetical protein ACKOXB_08990 [Flavobacteriales bacterium]
MKKSFTKNSVDSLLLGLQTIISANRYSLSVNDEVLLKDCVTALEEFKNSNKGDVKPGVELVTKVVELVSKFLMVGDSLKDLM